jgi:hypothetical protein
MYCVVKMTGAVDLTFSLSLALSLSLIHRIPEDVAMYVCDCCHMPYSNEFSNAFFHGKDVCM